MVSGSLELKSCFDERKLFGALLIILILAPLPLGSNREWAWPMLSCMIFFVSAIFLYHIRIYGFSPTAALWRARWVLYLLSAVALWQFIQIIPLPYELVSLLSPNAARAYGAAYDQVPQFIPLSLDVYATWMSCLKTLSYLLMFTLLLQLINSRHRLQWLLYTILYSGLFQACYGSFMALLRMEHGLFMANHQVMNATGSFINRNHFAGFLEICLGLGIGLLMAKLSRTSSATWKQRMRKLLNALLGEKARLRLSLAVMVVALVLSHSRMGNSAFFASLMIAGCIALAILWWRRHRGFHRHGGHSQRPVMLLLLSLIIIDLVIVGAWFGVDRVVDRIENTSVQTETRDEANEYAWQILSDYPITGIGAGAFYSAILGYQDQRVAGFYDQAHNDYLQFAVELGFPAVICLGIALFLCLRAAILAFWRRRSCFYFGVAFGGFMATLSILIHSFVDFNLQIPANALYFIVALSLGFISLTLESRRGRRKAVSGVSQEGTK